MNKAAINAKLNELASEYAKTLQQCLGEELVSVVLFGSVARKEASSTTDLDLLIIMRSLPKGQFIRKKRLIEADNKITPSIEALNQMGINISFSRILKTPEEASHMIPLYLDLVEDAVLLVDKDNFFSNILSQTRDRLRALGAKRIMSGQIRYWDLKPDLRPGEKFSI